MAGRTNLRKHSKIKRCKPGDKKKGRKHPIKDQKFCLWDSEGNDILYAAPTRGEAEGQERAVQSHSHNGSVILNGKVFRRSLIQAAVPGAPTWKLRVALSTEEMESKLRPWLAKLVPFAHKIEDEQENLLTQLPRKAEYIKGLQSNYSALVETLDLSKMENVADAYSDVGMSLVEISNDLQELFKQRSTYAKYLNQISPAFDKVGEDDPTKMLFLEAVASLHADEVVA